MKIIVAGCGKIGETIIEALVNENHDVTALDNDFETVENIRNKFDIIAICGNSTEYQKLKDAGIENTELFIAVTGSDELNMLSCFAAKRMGAKHTVARIRDLENNDEALSFMQEQLELSMAINPERLMAEAIYNIIKLPSAIKVQSFAAGKLTVLELILEDNTALEGKTLIDIRKEYKDKFLVCAVSRDEKVYIPNGNFALKGGDKIAVISSRRNAHKLINIFDIENIQVKNVMILGAGTVSSYLAKLLASGKHSVKIIEKDNLVAEEACEFLPDSVTIINGNGMDTDLLIEEGISSTDAFVCLTGKDESNILSSVTAIKNDVSKVITKINREQLIPIAENLGIDTIVSKRDIVADEIVTYARALENSIDSQIETLYSLLTDEIEALEFKVLPEFEYTNVPLKDIKFDNNVLIAGISRKNQVIIPTGNDVILPGDRVIVVAEGKRVLGLSDIIAR